MEKYAPRLRFMETTNAYSSDPTIHPSFAYYDERLNDILSPTLYPVPYHPVYSPPSGRQTSESLALPLRGIHMNHMHFLQDQNTRTIPIYHVSSPGTRAASAVSDSRKWSPTPSYAMPYRLTLGSEQTSSDMGSDALLFISEGNNVASTEQVALLPTQPDIPELCPGFISAIPYHCTHPSTNFTYATPLANNVAPLPSLLGSTGDGKNIAKNKRRPEIYHTPKKIRSGQPRSQNRHVVNIGGLWIDKDDLSCGADPRNNMIIVHECQWEKSSNPCGMWIAGSRSHVGAHIRRWHKKQYVNDSAKCLWSGCTKTMGPYSINRHVVTVHFGEGFYCEGCGEEFSRKDVYCHHAEQSEVCKDVVAAVAYRKKCRMIDTRHALQEEASPHYGSR